MLLVAASVFMKDENRSEKPIRYSYYGTESVVIYTGEEYDKILTLYEIHMIQTTMYTYTKVLPLKKF